MKRSGPSLSGLRRRNLSLGQIIRYRMPLVVYVSILHRVSGAFLFFSLPMLLYFFDRSLLSLESFDTLVGSLPLKFFFLFFVSLFLHHFLAGIRHLLADVDFGLEKGRARKTALVVFVFNLFFTSVFAIKLFGVFS